MKKSLALILALIMVLCLLPTVAFAKDNSTVVLHPSVNHTVTGVKVNVGGTINGHTITSIKGYDITVDLGKYNVNNDSFRLPYAKDIWDGVDDNKVNYITWAGSGSSNKSEDANALLANGKNTAYYYFKGAPTYKTFELKYDANGGTGAPATQTHTATSQDEGSYTFTISTQKPTREGYDFKGWAESPTATTATRQPGGTIDVTGTTTLYAVWANHEHKDENDDGFCDTDRECMHEKDNDRYCTVDGCTHPDTCCPKKPDNKPNPPEPENTSQPFIELTGEEAVKVECTNAEATHEDKEKSYGLKPGSYTIGNVKVTAEGGYTCDITVRPEQYVADYVNDPGHTLDPESQTRTITLKWQLNDGEDGTGKWKVDSDVPVVFKVVCAPVVDPSKPEKPSDDAVETLLGNAVVTIDCTNKVTHEDRTYGLLPGGFSVGDVQGDKENKYTVNVTVTPDAYVTQYSKDISEKHNLSPEGQDNLIITLKCARKGSEWEIVPFTTKTYTVVCGTGVTDMVTVSFNSNGGTAVASQTIAKGGKATKPADPTKDGYTFVNWYLDGKVYDFNTLVNEDITLYAQWKKNDDNPGQDPNPDPSPKPSPNPNPGGHDHGGHYHPTTTPVPVIVIPPKTGDMPFWYSIAQFLGLVK